MTSEISTIVITCRITSLSWLNAIASRIDNTIFSGIGVIPSYLKCSFLTSLGAKSTIEACSSESYEVHTRCLCNSTRNIFLDAQYYNALKSLVNLKGIEHPFVGSLHPFDDEWFLANIDPDWDFVFTTIPGVMGQLSRYAEFGIASDVEAGRQAALAFYERARQAVLQLNNHLNKQAVRFVQIHSSPNRLTGTSSARALQASLETMQSWDWDGAQLVVEHCDAYSEGQVPEKGFLTIEEEIEAVTAANKCVQGNIAMSINWGRSALEARGGHGPIEHIAKLKEANLLQGLIFSGASGITTQYGIWKDTHMPPAQAFGITSYAEGSFLTAEEIEKCLDASDYQELGFLGVKISVRPNDLTVEERVAYNRDALGVLDELTR